MRGATAYEYQIGRFGVRFVHLRGGYWRWKPWRRVSFQYFGKEYDQ